jgi:hypothetical protein
MNCDFVYEDNWCKKHKRTMLDCLQSEHGKRTIENWNQLEKQLIAEREAHEKTVLDFKNACDVGRRIDIRLTKAFEEIDLLKKENERLCAALQAIKYVYDEILAVRIPISGEYPMGVIARDALAGLEIVMGDPTATPSRSPSDSRDEKWDENRCEKEVDLLKQQLISERATHAKLRMRARAWKRCAIRAKSLVKSHEKFLKIIGASKI